MKHPLRTLFVLLFVVIFIRIGNSCAYSYDEDIVSQRIDPDAPYEKYVAGRLGAFNGNYRIRHMVIAYNMLSGRGLSPAERQAAIAVDKFYNSTDPSQSSYVQGGRKMGSEDAEWKGVDVDRAVPGRQYQSFTNCLDDAFFTASATLADRRAHYASPGQPDPPEIANWIAGQQAVFSNCAGPGQNPPPIPANAPLWLRQDRAYQLAAAQFYSLDYDQALAGFRAIAADHASAWSQLARYLVARALIRKAIVPYQFDVSTLDKMNANSVEARTGLRLARKQLESILRDPSMKPFHRQSRQLLDYVMIRLDPQAQAEELARRLTAPRHVGSDWGDADYRQNVIDLTYIYNSLPLYSVSYAQKDDSVRPATFSREPLIRWISDLAGGAQREGLGIESLTQDRPDPTARFTDARTAWRESKAPQWLVASLTTAAPGAQENEELMAAAKAIPPGSPAFASATYHRLRLAAGGASAAGQYPSNTKPVYAELSALLPKIIESQSLSTINLFADLKSSLSPTLENFLYDATRRAASVGSSDGGLAWTPPNMASATLCGVGTYAPDSVHFDEQTALIFNQRMPLHMLKDAALSSALPANVRFQLAHMAWTRALLLDDSETARALSPYLAGCQPAFASWLTQYNAARTTDERHAARLLALMRFTSTEPVVRVGIERDFAAYDGFRGNWWCTATPPSAGTSSPQDSSPQLFSDPIIPRSQQPDPPFLTAADRMLAHNELARLQKIPCASDYFAREVLAWVEDHPADSHDADLVGFAMRVLRNACRSDATKDLNHQLFDLLHHRFPKSEWATRYTTWE